MQADLASTAMRADATQTQSRSLIADRKDAPESITGDGAAPMINLIGSVEHGADGSTGVVVAATVVGYVAPAGLMVQVQLEPAEPAAKPEASAASDAAQDRKGMSPETGAPTASAVKSADELSPADAATVRDLQARDASVRREEQAHAAAAGAMAGPIRYEFATGPDGRRYVVNGSVPIRGGVATAGPEAAARDGRKLAAAAMSAQAPSAADYAAAAEGYRVAGAAHRQSVEEVSQAAADARTAPPLSRAI